jgi:hypothetical protein
LSAEVDEAPAGVLAGVLGDVPAGVLGDVPAGVLGDVPVGAIARALEVGCEEAAGEGSVLGATAWEALVVPHAARLTTEALRSPAATSLDLDMISCLASSTTRSLSVPSIWKSC